MPLPPAPRIGNLQLSSPLLMAPLSGRTDMAFRMGVRAIGGAALAFTDLTNPRGIMDRNLRTSQILATCEGDRPLGVQLYGSDPILLAEAAMTVEAEMNPEVIDVNMGCPVHKVTRKGAGSALMAQPALGAAIIENIAGSVHTPVTAKIRLGIDNEHFTAPEMVRGLVQAGAAAITIHGRMAVQRYMGKVDWQRTAEAVSAAGNIPTFANGNITDYNSALQALEVTGASGIAIGRGAMRNPWIFRDLLLQDEGLPVPPPDHRERVEFMRLHFRRLIKLRGVFRGCRQFRKWVSYYGAMLGMNREQRGEFMRIEQPRQLELLADQLLT